MAPDDSGVSVEHDHDIGVLRDERTGARHDGGPAAAQLDECARDGRLGVGVDGAGRVVEEEDVRVSEQPLAKRQALALAARKRSPLFWERRVELGREGRDHVGCLRRVEHGRHRRPARRFTPD